MLFCDLVGSTLLAARLDPEDLRDVIRAYHSCCEEIVRKFDGSVAQYLGDGVVARFGYPVAHEDDAERAIRCGLELIEGISEVGAAKGTTLEVRVGIATGVVVVGDQLGSAPTLERAAVGETPNVAARLQSLAQPGWLIIADRTKELIGNLFDCQDIGRVLVKGYAEPIRAWRVLRVGKVESRFEALRSRDAPLIGRDEEIELLRRRWTQAKSGEGRAVLLCGQSGIGKSRLAATLQEEIAAEPHARLQYFFSPHHQTSALYPIISQIRYVARFERDDDDATRLAKLDELLAQTSTSAEDAALIADLLSLPTGNRYPPLELTSQQRKDKTLAAILRQLKVLSEKHPVIMVFEDAHWSDPSSREFLDQVIENIQSLPALLLITYRPEFVPPWIGQPRVSTLVLNQLDRRDGATLIRRIVGSESLPDEVVNDIVERGDGVPLFVEELTKLVLETRLRLKDSGPSMAHVSALRSVPATLHGPLLARLDGLGSAMNTAQRAATIGREFSLELLFTVAGGRPEELLGDLDKLVNAGVLLQRRAPPNASFIFKHVLIQDAAYATLLRGPRQQLHARIADVLKEQFSSIALPEILAHHYANAGLNELAVHYWREAGERAISRSAILEATTLFRNALNVLALLPESRKKQELELPLRLQLVGTLVGSTNFASEERIRENTRARQLSEQLGDSKSLWHAVVGLWVTLHARGQHEEALQTAEGLMASTQEKGATTDKAVAHYCAAMTRHMRGEFPLTLSHLQKAVALFDMKNEPPLITYGSDVVMGTLSYLSRTLAALGHAAQARVASEQALARAASLNHGPTTGFGRTCAFITSWILRDDVEMARIAEAELAHARRQKLGYWIALGTILSGWARLHHIGIQAVNEMQASLTTIENMGIKFQVPFFLHMIASAYNELGQREEGLSIVAQALSMIERTGERWCEAELYWLKGTLLLGAPGSEALEAEACFVKAIEIAKSQSAKILQLRAAASLARHWQGQGRLAEARDCLVPVYDWFTEGLDTPDLKDAKAILDSLGVKGG